ncbi:MAG: hypothetical protein R3B13_31575 [Polyangiaceae bacterium]
MTPSEWRPLGAIPGKQLAPARVEAHYALQVLAAAATASIEARPDDSHQASDWQPERESLVTQLLGSHRMGLRLRDLTLQWIEEDMFVESEFALPGRSLDEAMAWARSALGASEALVRPSYDLPDHALAHGEMFSLGLDAALTELALWYDDAHALLTRFAEDSGRGAPVRCWPHHFDMACLLPESEQRSISLGMSPGDAHVAEPYLYVTPWPRPKTIDPLPTLPPGASWHTESWFGALLPASALATTREASAQATRAEEFLTQATAACRNLLRG